MKKQLITEQMLNRFGLSVKEFENETPEQKILRRNQEYLAKDETGRALLFGSINSSEVYMRAFFMGVIDDVADLAFYTHRGKDFVDSHVKVIKKYFVRVFPDFDNGAAISLGIHLTNSLTHIKKESLEIRRIGAAKHLFNDVKKRLQRSTSPFFVRLRKNREKLEVFEDVLRKYCEVVWLQEMQKEGTFTNNTLELYEDILESVEKEKAPSNESTVQQKLAL